MKSLFKIIGLLVLAQAMSFPLYAHSGMHQMTVFEAVIHFFSSPVHFGVAVSVCALILALAVLRSKAR